MFEERLVEAQARLQVRNVALRRALAAVRDALMSDRPEVINSATCDVAIARKHEYGFDAMADVVARTAELAEFADFTKLAAEFWIRRNDAMVANILKAAGESRGKRVVVLCGLEHRCYLRKELLKRAEKHGLVLREYWEAADRSHR